MMNYIIGYLVLGSFILLIIYIAVRMDNSKDAKELREIREFIKPQSKTWQDILVNKFFVPVIAISLSIIFWPVVVGLTIKDRLEQYAEKNRVEPVPEVFKVKKEHLKEQVSIEIIESQEIISDPLNAVPKLPFGHLNSVWQEFKGKYKADDEIWSFSALWTMKGGGKINYTGYVLVQTDMPKDYFTVKEKNIG